MSDWTREELSDGVIVIKCRGWTSFERFLHRYRSDLTNYVWRGQRCSDWKLQPSLDRLLLRLKRPEDPALRESILCRFKYAARGKIESSTRAATADEWWALGQHFGLATPLLDWTLSPYIAAFFAFSESQRPQTKDRAVLGLSAKLVKIKSKALDKAHPSDRQQGIRFISPIEGDNPRLIYQRGLLTRAPDGVDIESWIRMNFKGHTKTWVLLKVLVPNNSRSMFLRSLERMAITPVNLFPDLSGASWYTNLSLEVDQYANALSDGEVFDGYDQ